MKIQSKEHESDSKKSKKEKTNIDVKKIINLRLNSASGLSAEKVFRFDKQRIVIGSVVSADVRLLGQEISPIHAVVELSSGVGMIFDLASDSGVFLNGSKVVTHELKNTDVIKIGQYELRYTLDIVSAHSLLKDGEERTRETEGRVLFLDPKEDLRPLLLQEDREIEEIFDYRPTSKPSLEVVMSWCGSILDVEHFVDEKKVIVGNTRRSDFGIPPLLSASEYPIATQSSGTGFVLNVDTQMKGVLQQQGQLKSLDEVRAKARHGANGYEVPLGSHDFAKITLGDIDFYFSFTAAPPQLKRRRIFEKDPFFIRVFSTSLVLTVLFLAGLSRVKLPQAVEAEQVPERIATILYQPEKFIRPTPKPEPKPTVKVDLDKPKEPQKPVAPVQEKKAASAPKAAPAKPAAKAGGKEGEGARARGLEGTRGAKNKPQSAMKSMEANRPTGPTPVQEDSNVSALRGAGAKIQGILSSSSARLGDGKTVSGFSNFTSAGSGGLALSGSGQGGGGTAETTLGGLANKGSGMGKVGTGMSAAGNSKGLSNYSRIDIQTDGPGEQVVMGGIDEAAVAEAINAHKDEFRLCYEKEINAENPNLSGRVAVKFEIGSSGRVNHAGIDSSSLRNASAESCVVKVIKRIPFPTIPGGGVAVITKTFTFNAVK